MSTRYEEIKYDGGKIRFSLKQIWKEFNLFYAWNRWLILETYKSYQAT